MKHLTIYFGLLITLLLTNSAIAQDLNKAYDYFNTQQYEKAALEFEGALPTIKKEYGKNDTSLYSKVLLYTAFSFERYYNKEKALEYYLLCNSIYENIGALDNQYYSNSLSNLAELYETMGQYDKALPLYLEALENTKKHLVKIIMNTALV